MAHPGVRPEVFGRNQPLETKASSWFQMRADSPTLTTIATVRPIRMLHAIHALSRTTKASAWTPKITGKTTTAVIACAPRTDFALEPNKRPSTTIAKPATSDRATVSSRTPCETIVNGSAAFPRRNNKNAVNPIALVARLGTYAAPKSFPAKIETLLSGVARSGPSVPCSRSPTNAVSAACSPAMYGKTNTSVMITRTISGRPLAPMAPFAITTGKTRPKTTIIVTERRSWSSARSSRRMTTNVPASAESGRTSSRIARAPHDVDVGLLQRAVDLVDCDHVGAGGNQSPHNLGVRPRD